MEAGFFDKSEAKMVTNLHILCRKLIKNAIGNNKVTKLARYSQKSGGLRIKMRPKNELERAVSNAARGLANSVHGMHKICAASRLLHKAACISTRGRAAALEPSARLSRRRDRGVPQTTENADIFIRGSHCAPAEIPVGKAAIRPLPTPAARGLYNGRSA